VNFDALDRRMRVFETAHDHCVLPEIHMVARLDGRNFTRLTKEVQQFEAPFDIRFRDLMLTTVEHLMTCGFAVVYGYTQSDEISLLLQRDEQTFGRKLRKYNSVLAGEASACFSLALGAPGVFDCRISQLPTAEQVIDYFRWRQEDAHRNSLNAHCYWMLRKEGQSVAEATQALVGISVSEKNEMLFSRGINFNELPTWQKRGMGVYWETFRKASQNPVTGEAVEVDRQRLMRDLELPLGETYDAFIADRLRAQDKV
jgi:tRNA(His) guanylyltransferase